MGSETAFCQCFAIFLHVKSFPPWMILVCLDLFYIFFNVFQGYGTCFLIFLPALVMGNFMVLNLFLALLLNSFNSEELKSKKEASSFP